MTRQQQQGNSDGIGKKAGGTDNDDASANTANRKRPLDEIDSSSSSKPSPQLPVAARRLWDDVPTNFAVRAMKLEAIFHPKFENENMDDQQIRNTMQTLVGRREHHNRAQQQEGHQQQKKETNQNILGKNENSDSASNDYNADLGAGFGGGGYLEASLKHSGSLLLWSGGQRYYSKNSTSNKFTQVGEILLRQHFVRAYWTDQQLGNVEDAKEGGDKAASMDVETAVDETMYEKCSDYVEKHRLTLSFEVVTSVLGDHGDKPRRDFLVLTAVASRCERRFYSTVELVELAHRFRLPHNDCWVFSSPQGVDGLFRMYDASRETGLAGDVARALCDAADEYLPGMYDHEDFQGDILEGIVIRYVPPVHDAAEAAADDSDGLRAVRNLAKAAQDLKKKVPSSLQDCHELVTSSGGNSNGSPVLSTNLRELLSKCDSPASSSFDDDVGDALTRGSGKRRLTSKLPRSDGLDVPTMTQSLVGSRHEESRQIACLMQSLSGITSRIEYALFREECEHPDASHRILCIIHVFDDDTFRKYRRTMKPGDMPLFRGFVVELIGSDCAAASTNDDDVTDAEIRKKLTLNPPNRDRAPGPNLMLKMKFLPYMVRTFGCRNGLRVLEQGGPEAFVHFADNLLSKWKISNRSKLKWRGFFKAWSRFAHECLQGKNEAAKSRGLAPLSGFYYLDYLELFQKLYESGEIKSEESDRDCSFEGLVVVVSVLRETAEAVSDYVAKETGCARRVSDINTVSPTEMGSFCEPRSGAVASAAVTDGIKVIRGLVKKYGEEYVRIVLFQCSEEEIGSMLLPQNEVKKNCGMLRAWRQTKCSLVAELPRSSLFDEASMDTGDAPDCRPGEEFKKVLQNLQTSPAVDTRPGLIAIFPGIPGCGKSSLVGPVAEEELRGLLPGTDSERARNLTVLVGDKIREKYWPLVKRHRLKDRSGVYIADKNLPPSSWDYVAQICAATHGVVVPVLPDAAAFSTTTIQGMRKPGGALIGESVHNYPFSLAYLALCMARVRARASGTHVGKLDGSTPRACMIVVKFFSLYRRITADQFRGTLRSAFETAGCLLTSSPIVVPFFAGSAKRQLPKDLENTLVEALQTQFGYDIEDRDTGKDKDGYVDDLERRLRKLVQKYSAELLSTSAEESVSRKSMVDQLVERVHEVDSMSSYEAPEAASSFIKLVAIDVEMKSMIRILRDLSMDERCSAVMERMLEGRSVEETYSEGKFISRPHVTLDHFKSSSQENMRTGFESVRGSKVQLKATGILWNERVVALSVLVSAQNSDGVNVPRSRNDFVHITVWCHESASSVESNDLIEHVKCGRAHRVEFDDPVELAGTVTFW